MFLVLLLGALLSPGGWAMSHEDFISQCVRWNYNQICDLQCYNFTGGVNDFELEDCSDVKVKKYDWEREVTVYPLNASAYLQYFERQMREDLGTRAEIITTEEEMRAIEEDYIKSIDDHVNKRKKTIKLKYAIYLRECDTCPQGVDYIAETLSLSKQEFMRRQTVDTSSSPVAGLIFGVIGLCCLATVGIGMIKINNKRRATDDLLPFSFDRRKKFVHVPKENTVYPPMEEVGTTKKKGKRTLQQRDLNRPYTYNKNMKRPKLEDDLNPFYSIPIKIPPAPTIPPPPIHEGILADKSLYYQPQLPRQASISRRLDFLMSGHDEDAIIRLLEEELRKDPSLDIDSPIKADGSSPLIMAVRRRHTKVARRLLQLGADVHRFTSCYSNALHHAVHNEDAPMLKVLLEDRNRFLEQRNGRTAIDALNQNDETPLMICARSVSLGATMAKILIQAGANICDAGEFACAETKERTVLHHAAKQYNIQLLEYLLEEARQQGKLDKIIDNIDKNHHTALWYACENAHPEAVKLLLEAGADQYIPDHTKEDCPLAIAEDMENQEILALLHESKEKVRTGGSTRFLKNRKKPKRRSSGGSSTVSEDTNSRDSVLDEEREEAVDQRLGEEVLQPDFRQVSMESGFLFEDSSRSFFNSGYLGFGTRAPSYV